jgi:ABC-type nitrate/sulfonate/bicarbonate transport system substrate-binding protein
MIDQGIDKKYGLAAEYRAYPTLDGLFTAIRGKDVDVGFGGWTAIAQFRGKGMPVTMIFPVGRGVTVDVIVPTDSPIKSIADL